MGAGLRHGRPPSREATPPPSLSGQSLQRPLGLGRRGRGPCVRARHVGSRGSAGRDGARKGAPLPGTRGGASGGPWNQGRRPKLEGEGGVGVPPAFVTSRGPASTLEKAFPVGPVEINRTSGTELAGN